MRRIEYFDYESIARKKHVPPTVLKRIEREAKVEFPKDRMMYELHVLRAVKSGYWLHARM